MEFFSPGGTVLLSVPAGCSPEKKRGKHASLRARWCAGLLGLLGCWPCWPAGLAGALGLLGRWACWLAGLQALFSFFFFFFFSFAGCLLPAFFLFFFSTIFLFLLVVQIFICTLKHNIKFRLNKINIIHIK